MTGEQHAKRIEELFRLGVELRPEERGDFLARHCGGNEELRAELELLLGQDDAGTKAYLESPVLSAWSKSDDTSRAAPDAAAREVTVGTRTERIGRYRIVEKLGEGGMGAVYLARQEDPVGRDVALKIVKLGMDTRRVVARFDRERQALALMDHPGIARIYDGGATDSGRPYFVMEYVPGAPITEHCDRRRLTVRERLELFVRVCDAVHHAHGKGIVHRDLKPSNILITERDGQPVPKVIDFGIARATSNADHVADRSTRTREVIGTFAYMSPEQADPESGDVDGRSDVYALGVLLFELLVGTQPVDAAQIRDKSPSEVSRFLRETAPPAPSTELTRLGAASVRLALRRGGLDVRSLAKCMSGDLDWITLKAVERDPERRYATVALLANDIRRHLAGRAVLAGPPSVGYRTVKFVRRHRVGVAASTALVLVLGLGIAGTRIGLALASEKAEAARAIEEQALRAAGTWQSDLAESRSRIEQLERLADELLGVVDLANPESAPRSDESIVALLKELGTGIGDRLAGDPLREARLRLSIGQALHSRGRPELALEQYAAAHALQERGEAPAPDRYDVQIALHRLGADTSSFGDMSAGLLAARLGVELLADTAAGAPAGALLQHAEELDLDSVAEDLEALQKSASSAGEREKLVAADVVGIAGAYLGLHLAFSEADPLLQGALALRVEVLGETHPAVVRSLEELVEHRLVQGRTDAAAAALHALEPAFARSFPNGHWLRSEVDSLRGECLSLQGRYEAASELLETAEARIARERGPMSRSAVLAALRLREHRERSGESDPARRAGDLLAGPFAASRDRDAAWVRTLARLGASETDAQCLRALFAATRRSGDLAADAAVDAVRRIVALMERESDENLAALLFRALGVIEPQLAAATPLRSAVREALAVARPDSLPARSRPDRVERSKVPVEQPYRLQPPPAQVLAVERVAQLTPEGGVPGAGADDAPEAGESLADALEIEALKQALGEALEAGADPLQLVGPAWSALTANHEDEELLGLAFLASAQSVAWAPEEETCLTVLGLALTRAGHGGLALELLHGLKAPGPALEAAAWAVRGLALVAAGHGGLAARALVLAEDAAAQARGLDPGTRRLLAELRRLVRR